MMHSLPWNVERVVGYCQTSPVFVALCDHMVYQVWGLINTSFCYLESVGKCNEAYQTNQSLEIGE